MLDGCINNNKNISLILAEMEKLLSSNSAVWNRTVKIPPHCSLAVPIFTLLSDLKSTFILLLINLGKVPQHLRLRYKHIGGASGGDYWKPASWEFHRESPHVARKTDALPFSQYVIFLFSPTSHEYITIVLRVALQDMQ